MGIKVIECCPVPNINVESIHKGHSSVDKYSISILLENFDLNNKHDKDNREKGLSEAVTDKSFKEYHFAIHK